LKGFRELKVWEKAHLLTLAVYGATAQFPKEELYGLTSQLRRSAASIPCNLAEGVGRSGNAEFARFCRIAMGSASELEYELFLAKDLGLLAGSAYESLESNTVENQADADLTRPKADD
jgi:four helix bundle protein